MNKAKVVEWYDDINPDSYVLIPLHYEVKILHAIPVDDDRTEVVIYGSVHAVDKFLDDLEDGTVEPFESMGVGDYDDEDYVAWLNNEVNYVLDLIDAEALNYKERKLKKCCSK